MDLDDTFELTLVGKKLRHKERHKIWGEIAVGWYLSNAGSVKNDEIFVNAIVDTDDNGMLMGRLHAIIMELMILK